jgi:hypothetical protein
VIDADYRGLLGVLLFNLSETDFESECRRTRTCHCLRVASRGGRGKGRRADAVYKPYSQRRRPHRSAGARAHRYARGAASAGQFLSPSQYSLAQARMLTAWMRRVWMRRSAAHVALARRVALARELRRLRRRRPRTRRACLSNRSDRALRLRNAVCVLGCARRRGNRERGRRERQE